ncbi:MAG: carbonic anhydrase [Anaerolineae bacterium]
MSDLQTLLERNQQFTARYEGGLHILPKFSTFILTCADARIDPTHFFGLELGEAMVFRNAGGRVTDDVELELGVLWLMAAHMAGNNFRGISLALIQHTDCGFERLANPEMAAILSNRLSVAKAVIDGLANANHSQRLHEDIERLRQSPLVPKGLVVSGHIYHVEDGTIEEIVAPAPLQSESS